MIKTPKSRPSKAMMLIPSKENRIPGIIMGVIITGSAAYNLIVGSHVHDVPVIVALVIGAGLIYPDPIINIIKAWRGNKSAE